MTLPIEEDRKVQRVFDPHVHLWSIASRDDDDVHNATELNCLLSLEADVAASGMRLVGAVHTEAMSSSGMEELLWSAGLSQRWDKPLMIVADVDMASPSAQDDIQRLIQADTHKCLRGIRHIMDIEPTWPWTPHDVLTDPIFQQNYASLGKLGLSYELQATPSQLLDAAPLAERHPEVTVIVNHFGCLNLTHDSTADAKAIDEWRAGMKALAEAGSHVYVKISMLTFCDANWDSDDSIVPSLVSEIIELFTARRCMFASNYPVDFGELDVPTGILWRGYQRLCEHRSKKEKANLWYRSAQRAYRVPRKQKQDGNAVEAGLRDMRA
eukprot:TRINITY_DN10977_c0_g1_i2.p1 TRINITY_DN10977_c0_g1~~TRINITY_DN10977_c0_g1_i2.p1  ORF type:complete len:325 (+),score=33.69 TRINITY_DN10977_c0_g1_i2:169-1143(+)